MKIFILIGIAIVFYLLRANVMAAPILKIGDDAPTFALPDSQGNQVNLTDYKGKWLVLYFYPKDDTPGCTTEACHFRDDFKFLESLGAKVVGVSIDDSFSHKKFAEKYNLPFPLLSDSSGEVASRYGALNNFLVIKLAKRYTYLINPQGKIAKIYLSIDTSKHSQEIIEDLKTLKQQI
ncbi:peroxiredoxin [Candidatus Methylopumilus planktonicus]|uniref:peroxiredoxin n=1 Tax=Candidatus Methylopumilus TaxID=1679002 RepID=UPI00111F312F|nr:peroxiredoxin [Candidatus Methylopumilus planktonicus]QDD00778.1 peroxiredoxin [Candidatus Methylopumilus planktonicus]QDD02108.1 peroxiredoxin [Candidatus Methylopumilus planktonicus]